MINLRDPLPRVHYSSTNKYFCLVPKSVMLIKMGESLKKDLEELKSNQTMMNSTINEIKNSLEEIGRAHV